MRKIYAKLIAVVLTIAMICSMSCTAFAANTQGEGSGAPTMALTYYVDGEVYLTYTSSQWAPEGGQAAETAYFTVGSTSYNSDYTDPTKDGYTFYGWSASYDESGADSYTFIVKTGETLQVDSFGMPTVVVNLYAVWEEDYLEWAGSIVDELKATLSAVPEISGVDGTAVTAAMTALATAVSSNDCDTIRESVESVTSAAFDYAVDALTALVADATVIAAAESDEELAADVAQAEEYLEDTDFMTWSAGLELVASIYTAAYSEGSTPETEEPETEPETPDDDVKYEYPTIAKEITAGATVIDGVASAGITDTLTYTLTATGSDDPALAGVTALVFTDILPTGLSLVEGSVSATVDGAEAVCSVAPSEDGFVVTVTVSSLTAVEEVVVTYQAVIADDDTLAGSSLTNSAYVSWDGDEDNNQSGIATATVVVTVKTGGEGTVMYTICGMMLLCAAAVVVARKKYN